MGIAANAGINIAAPTKSCARAVTSGVPKKEKPNKRATNDTVTVRPNVEIRKRPTLLLLDMLFVRRMILLNLVPVAILFSSLLSTTATMTMGGMKSDQAQLLTPTLWGRNGKLFQEELGVARVEESLCLSSSPIRRRRPDDPAHSRAL